MKLQVKYMLPCALTNKATELFWSIGQNLESLFKFWAQLPLLQLNKLLGQAAVSYWATEQSYWATEAIYLVSLAKLTSKATQWIITEDI